MLQIIIRSPRLMLKQFFNSSPTSKCGVGADCDVKEVMPIIEQKLKKASEEQNALGHNAKYKHIEFEKHDDDDLEISDMYKQ
eukprot:10717467-Ditylum_brightwellii.AAC.1